MDFPHILHRGTALVVPSYCYKLFMAAANGLLVAYGLFQSAKTIAGWQRWSRAPHHRVST